MIPCSAKIFLAAALTTEINAVSLKGFQSSAICLHPVIQEVPAFSIKSKAEEILSLDLYSAPSDFNSFRSPFELTIPATSKINALVGWFDVQMTADSWMTTSPFGS